MSWELIHVQRLPDAKVGCCAFEMCALERHHGCHQARASTVEIMSVLICADPARLMPVGHSNFTAKTEAEAVFIAPAGCELKKILSCIID